MATRLLTPMPHHGNLARSPSDRRRDRPTGEIDTKRQQEKKIKDKDLVFEAIDPKEVKVRVYGEAAIVMGLYHIKATLNGRTVDGVFRNTEVFAKQAGRWRCVFNQVTPVAGPPAEKR
jgi:ketosteroid isomerase-like protein